MCPSDRNLVWTSLIKKRVEGNWFPKTKQDLSKQVMRRGEMKLDFVTTRVRELNVTTPFFFCVFFFFALFLYVSQFFSSIANGVFQRRGNWAAKFLEVPTRRQQLTLSLNYISKKFRSNSDYLIWSGTYTQTNKLFPGNKTLIIPTWVICHFWTNKIWPRMESRSWKVMVVPIKTSWFEWGEKTIPKRNEACRLENTIDFFFR